MRSISLQLRLVVVMCIAYIVVSLSTLIVSYQQQDVALHRQQAVHARTDAAILAAGSVAPLRNGSTGSLAGLRTFVTSLSGERDVSYASVIGGDGCVAASTAPREVGTCGRLKLVSRPISISRARDNVEGRAPIVFETNYDGFADVIISGSSVAQDLQSSLVSGALVRLAGLLFFIVLSLAIARFLLGPLEAMARAARALRANDLTARAPVPSARELRTLAEAFNAMAASLEVRIRHLSFLVQAGPTLPTALREGRSIGPTLEEFCSQIDARAVGLFPSPTNGSQPLWCAVAGDPNASRERATAMAAAAFQARAAINEGSSLALPVVGDGVFVALRNEDRPFSDEERQVISNFAYELGVAVENAHLFTMQQEALQVKDQFLSIVSHELRTPLTTIKGYAQMLRQKLREDPTDQRFARNIDVQVDRLSRLVDDLLDVTRFARGQFELRREPMDLIPVVEEAVARFKVVSSRHTIVLDVGPGRFEGNWDHDRLEQVLNNLIGNAIKYSPDGGEVRVSVEQSHGNAVVRVRDQGVGIPEEDQGRLFERFYRAGGAGKEIQGLGLGLYVTHRIIEAHGGTIAVRSRAGEGSEFYFTLPLSRSAVSAPVPS